MPAWPARFAPNRCSDDGDRVRRGHADRLVEHDPAMHVALSGAFLLRPSAACARGVARSLRHGARARPTRRVISGHQSSFSAFEIALHHRCSQKLLDPFRFVESLVDAEANLGRKFQVNAPRDLAAHIASCCVPSASSTAFDVAAAERHDIDGREPQIRRHPHFGHRDQMRFDHRDRGCRRATACRRARGESIRRRATGAASRRRTDRVVMTWHFPTAVIRGSAAQARCKIDVLVHRDYRDISGAKRGLLAPLARHAQLDDARSREA